MSKKPIKKKSSVSVNSPDDKLAAWLTEQATKLKNLQAKGNKLKLDFVQNAKEKGDILLRVHDRITTDFKMWVIENTDIGYSTAHLWMDVASNYAEVKKLVANSNPLELTVRQVRDARQERGEGKPGSGKRNTTATDKTSTDETGGADTDVPRDDEATETGDQDDVTITGEEDAPDNGRWEREAGKAEAEAAEIDSGEKTELKMALYKVTVMLFAESDQEAIKEALSNWSPISTMPVSTKQFRSVVANVPSQGIGNLLQQLGTTLQQTQPKKVRVSIEL